MTVVEGWECIGSKGLDGLVDAWSVYGLMAVANVDTVLAECAPCMELAMLEQE